MGGWKRRGGDRYDGINDENDGERRSLAHKAVFNLLP